jgi:hypothetical protein
MMRSSRKIPHRFVVVVAVAVGWLCGFFCVVHANNNNNNNKLDPCAPPLKLEKDLRHIIHQSQAQFRFKYNQIIDYSISDGRSCLRNLANEERQWFGMTKLHDDDDDVSSITTRKTVMALLFFLRGNLSAAHEVILGVNLRNMEEGEYAASHRGETSWNDDHPLSIEDDIVHSLIHMCEGDNVGEGGYLGWENAKYWAAGGDKKWYNSPQPKEDGSSVENALIEHPVYQALHKVAIKQNLSHCVDRLWPKEGRTHDIIAGGGKYRTVAVPSNCWDPFHFIELNLQRERLHAEIRQQLDKLQEMLVMLLLRFTLIQSYANTSIIDLDDSLII